MSLSDSGIVDTPVDRTRFIVDTGDAAGPAVEQELNQEGDRIIVGWNLAEMTSNPADGEWEANLFVGEDFSGDVSIPSGGDTDHQSRTTMLAKGGTAIDTTAGWSFADGGASFMFPPPYGVAWPRGSVLGVLWSYNADFGAQDVVVYWYQIGDTIQERL